jgi:hypothetical protein
VLALDDFHVPARAGMTVAVSAELDVDRTTHQILTFE